MLADLLEFAQTIVFQGVLDQLDLVVWIELVEESFVQGWLWRLAQSNALTPVRSEYQVLCTGVDSIRDCAKTCYIPLLELVAAPLLTALESTRDRVWIRLFCLFLISDWNLRDGLVVFQPTWIFIYRLEYNASEGRADTIWLARYLFTDGKSFMIKWLTKVIWIISFGRI